MWYVVQTLSAKEDFLVDIINAFYPEHDDIFSMFVIHYEKFYKIRGKMIKKKKALFPGYVFFATEQREYLFYLLSKVPELTKMLGYDEGPAPISVEEQEFLHSLLNKENEIETSEGYIIGDKLIITEGPLVGKEGYITKIDRHKRMATLSVDFLGAKRDIQVGLEVINKIVCV